MLKKNNMDAITIANQDAVILKNEEDYFSFLAEALDNIDKSDTTLYRKKFWKDKITINKDLLSPSSYPTILMPHPDSENKKLPWYFITKSDIEHILKLLNQSKEDCEIKFEDRFSKDR